jgi:3-hydroxyisobutyrate dehydrogenase-like beta-hydroxyacid dehydrogenase
LYWRTQNGARSFQTMAQILTLFGYGEAGRTFARAAGWEAQAQVFDVKTDSAQARDAVLPDYDADGVSGATNPIDALRNSLTVLSLVTADQALAVAQNAAQHILPNALYFDMNSVAPDTKRAAAKLIDAAGGRYVDVAVMAPVQPARLAVPLLLSGPYADEGAAALTELGFTNLRVVAGDIGRASSIKMIRSIMVKGQEALTAELMLAAEAADVVDEVLGSLGDGWDAKAEYNLERMRTHGIRRAAEMEEVANTLMALGIEPVMTSGTIKRQREMAQMELNS